MTRAPGNASASASSTSSPSRRQARCSGVKGAVVDSVLEETEALQALVGDLLHLAGSDKTKILSATIWINTMDDFAEMKPDTILVCAATTPAWTPMP